MKERSRANGKWICSFTGIALLAAIVGCDAAPTTHPVSGTVKHKGGKAWSGGTITFQLESDRTVNPTGTIQKDGSFTLTTHYNSGSSSSTKPGAPAGQYAVTVEPDYGPELPTVIKGNTVSQKFTVKEGDNSFTVEVDR